MRCALFFNKVIDALLKQEFSDNFQRLSSRSLKRKSKQQTGYFEDILFNESDWCKIKALNDELEVKNLYSFVLDNLN